MTSFEEIKIVAIRNNQAWKVTVTNYYIENDFHKAGGIDCNPD